MAARVDHSDVVLATTPERPASTRSSAQHRGGAVTVAGCESCGHTVEAAGERGFFGESAGPCPSCGRLMLWMTPEDGATLRDGTSRPGLTRAVERARQAATALRRLA